MKFSILSAATLVTLSILSLPSAFAQQSQPPSLSTDVSVVGNCKITAPETLNFGSYDQVGAHKNTAIEVSSSMAVQCTSGTKSIVIHVDKGLNDNGTGCANPLRRMRGSDTANSGSFMAYSIGYGPNPTENSWGCNGEPGQINGGVATGDFENGLEAKVLPVYGYIAPGSEQSEGRVQVGNYSDTINFSVSF